MLTKLLDLSVLPAAEPGKINLCRLATLGVMGLEIAEAAGLTIPAEVLALAQAAQAKACGTPTPTPSP